MFGAENGEAVRGKVVRLGEVGIPMPAAAVREDDNGKRPAFLRDVDLDRDRAVGPLCVFQVGELDRLDAQQPSGGEVGRAGARAVSQERTVNRTAKTAGKRLRPIARPSLLAPLSPVRRRGLDTGQAPFGTRLFR